MTSFYREKEAMRVDAKKAYQFLIDKYNTPLDIPKNAWMQGKDMEIGKWYLWVNQGKTYQFDIPSTEQHIIMIPELHHDKVQTVKDFNVLWYLHGPNFKLFNTGLSEGTKWHSKEDLDIELESFGLVEESYFVVGPLEYGGGVDFINWGSKNPWEVKE